MKVGCMDYHLETGYCLSLLSGFWVGKSFKEAHQRCKVGTCW